MEMAMDSSPRAPGPENAIGSDEEFESSKTILLVSFLPEPSAI